MSFGRTSELRWPVRSCSLILAALVAAIPMAPSRTYAAADVSPVEIFARVSPAVPFVETPSGQGSGILVDEGLVLTAAHVVWPHAAARVLFPNGVELSGAPVVAWDLMADLAVIEVPSTIGVAPVRVADGPLPPVGTELYVIGYPGGAAGEPQPTLSRGLLSRFRTASPIEIAYLQTDANTRGGASGGALVGPTGQVVGIVQFRHRGFGVAASATQAVERVRRLLAGEALEGLGGRRLLPETPSGTEYERSGVLRGARDERAFILRAPAGVRVVAGAVADHDVRLAVYRDNGDLVRSASQSSGREVEVACIAEENRSYVLVVGQFSDRRQAFRVGASQPLAPLLDPDDGRPLRPGELRAGNLDHARDIDFWPVDLEVGQTVVVEAHAVMFDPLLEIHAPGGTARAAAVDDDSGGGLFGRSARLTFTAEVAGTHLLRLAPSDGPDYGGYLISLASAGADASDPGFATTNGGAVPGSGFTLFVFGGGSSEQLAATAGCTRSEVRFWVASEGTFVPYVPGSRVLRVNAAWHSLFPQVIPPNTVLLMACAD